MEARAAVLNRIGGPLTIERLRIDDPGPFEVLIRTAAAGVCHRDRHGFGRTGVQDLQGPQNADGQGMTWSPGAA